MFEKKILMVLFVFLFFFGSDALAARKLTKKESFPSFSKKMSVELNCFIDEKKKEFCSLSFIDSKGKAIFLEQNLSDENTLGASRSKAFWSADDKHFAYFYVSVGCNGRCTGGDFLFFYNVVKGKKIPVVSDKSIVTLEYDKDLNGGMLYVAGGRSKLLIKEEKNGFSFIVDNGCFVESYKEMFTKFLYSFSGKLLKSSSANPHNENVLTDCECSE